MTQFQNFRLNELAYHVEVPFESTPSGLGHWEWHLPHAISGKIDSTVYSCPRWGSGCVLMCTLQMCIYYSSFHFIFHYPHITPIYYSSFHFKSPGTS